MLTLSKKELMIFCNGRREVKHSKLCRGSKRKYNVLLQSCDHLHGGGNVKTLFSAAEAALLFLDEPQLN